MTNSRTFFFLNALEYRGITNNKIIATSFPKKPQELYEDYSLLYSTLSVYFI